jgi:hypothetical protein
MAKTHILEGRIKTKRPTWKEKMASNLFAWINNNRAFVITKDFQGFPLKFIPLTISFQRERVRERFIKNHRFSIFNNHRRVNYAYDCDLRQLIWFV